MNKKVFKKNQEQCRDYIENVKLIWVLYFYGVIVIIIIIIILGCVIVLVSKVGVFLVFFHVKRDYKLK